MITILAIGKKDDDWVSPGVQRFESRLKKPFDLNWLILPHSTLSDAAARQEESGRILSRISAHAFVILLDERGDNLTSPEFSQLLEARFTVNKQIIFIIGGAYGVDDRVHQRADVVWSLSSLVFPHQLVRLILVEQLYRAQQITAGHPYHHG